jgi:gliding motility-associated-like protein
MKKPLLLLFLCLLSLQFVKAQTDNEFWFVAPEATSSHGDAPIVIRMAALNQAATVTIDQPANLGFTPIVVNIPANSTSTVDLTPWITVIENQPANQVLNFGIHIVSTVNITAYYEINTSCNCNPEIFALKGRNALGTEFYTPFQNFWSNGNYSPAAYSSFEIVATEDNTTVTITPTQNITGHTAGVPFQIVLNKGQTYSAAAAGLSPAEHLGGSLVTSNKPIAITIKDDSVADQGCRDMMGDQIVPTNIIGNEYIVMKGFLDANANEQVFILATVDNTDIFIDGSGTPAATINTGQTFAYPITNPSTYINASQNVYVLHASGFGCELASALLPPINCTGSSAVYFIRSTAELFGLNIMIRAGDEGNFTLNGNNTLVPAGSFAPVPGTGGNWVAAQIQYNTTDVPVNTTNLLTNSTGIFHMGLINGDISSGCRYGYFSNYSQINIGPDVAVCPDTAAILDAGANYDSYQWSTGDTTQTIVMPTPGTYWVTVTRFGCTATDTVQVTLNPAPNISLNQDTVICSQSAQVVLDAGSGFGSYLWNNGDTTQTTTVGPGTYIVIVTNSFGCSSPSSDTANIVLNIPQPTLGQDTVICDPNGTITINAGSGFSSYLWSNGDQTQTTVVPPGSYFVTVTNSDGCSGISSDSITINVLPTIALFDNSVDTTLIGLPVQFVDSSEAGTGTLATWLWDFGDGSTSTDQNPQHQYSDTGSYNVTLIVTNSEGCTDTFTVVVTVIELPVFVPNVFTPNADGFNDFLVFAALEQFPESKLWVYNRWGNLLYNSNDYKNDWDGDNATDGVYYFILEVNHPSGVKKHHGTVTLLK